MNNTENRLSELDIKYITKILGRIPTDIEIDFIELILKEEIENRGYLQILKRLNDGAKRVINNKIVIGDKSELHFNTGCKIINNGHKLVVEKDETVYLNNINGWRNILNDLTVISPVSQGAEKIRKKEILNRKDCDAIGGRVVLDGKLEMVFSTSIGLGEAKDNLNLFLKGALIYKISFGKRTVQKNIKKLKTSLAEINNESWFSNAELINGEGMGKALIRLMRRIHLGIQLTNILSVEGINPYFGPTKDVAALFVIPSANVPRFSAFCNKHELVPEEIGIIIEDFVIQIDNKLENLVNLPESVFDLQFNVNVQHFREPFNVLPISEKNKKVKSTSLTNQLTKLFIAINEKDVLWSLSTTGNKFNINHFGYGFYSNINLESYQLVMTHADNNHLIDIAPRLSGRISVANAMRKLVCTGAKPRAVMIQNVLPKTSKQSLWQASELLQGQEETVRELEVDIGDRSLFAVEDYWYQNITSFGSQKQDSVKMDISLKQNGDFISLLGSLRGELVGSEYERLIVGQTSDTFPSVDLKMEKRLQDVVHQGINTNLLKSATNVNKGGLAIAIANSLVVSESKLGARIFLSRKLKNEELLFGETQGLVIVSLAEKDIMEFERICMTIGVPSTTIGRVTDNGLFTFNDSIKIKVDRLRKIIA